MKKILFGIMALSLSMAAFGAAETTSVPVMVQCNVITAPTGLVITDEAGQVLTELNIDHGNIVKPTADTPMAVDPSAYKIFKVRRYKADGTGTLDQIAGTTGTNKTLTVRVTGAGGSGNTTQLKKDGTLATGSLTSTLKLDGDGNPTSPTSYTKTLTDETEHTGRVTSTIAKTGFTNAKVGLYNNARDAKLEVTYTP